MPKISIIIPVYNAERHLTECLDSIVSQSFIDWECICVDDGSTDSSAVILDDYAERDGRIKVLKQENKGPSVARTSGIQEACGEYVLFQDADDFIENNAYEKLIEIVNELAVDLLGFSYTTYPDNRVSHFSMRTEQVLSSDLLLKSTKNPQSSDDFSFSWRYMIRRSLLVEKKIFFDPDICIGEDTLFIMEVFSHARSIYLTEYAPYRYRVNNEQSIMHATKYNSKLEHSLTLLYKKKRVIINRNHWDELTPFSFDLAARAITSYGCMLMENRKVKGESKDKYIREVLHLPMMQDAMNVIGFKNIFSNWKEYMVYLCMRCCFMPVLKRYF